MQINFNQSNNNSSLRQALREIHSLTSAATSSKEEIEILVSKVRDLQSDLASSDDAAKQLQNDIEMKNSSMADFEGKLLAERSQFDVDLMAAKTLSARSYELRSMEESKVIEGLKAKVQELESNESSRALSAEKLLEESVTAADALKIECASLTSRFEEMRLRYEDEMQQLKMKNDASLEKVRLEHETHLTDLKRDVDCSALELEVKRNYQACEIKNEHLKQINDLSEENRMLVESVSLLEGRLISPEQALREKVEVDSAAGISADEKECRERKIGSDDSVPVPVPVLEPVGAVTTQLEVTTNLGGQPSQVAASSDEAKVATESISGDAVDKQCRSEGGEANVGDLKLTISALQTAASSSLHREDKLREEIIALNVEISKMSIEVGDLQARMKLQAEEVGIKKDALTALEEALGSSSIESDFLKAQIAEEKQQRQEVLISQKKLVASKDEEVATLKELLESEQERAEGFCKVVESLKLASQSAASEIERLKVCAWTVRSPYASNS